MKLTYSVVVLILGLFLNMMASEYDLDAILKAKGENKKAETHDKKLQTYSEKAHKKAAEQYYYEYTLPAQKARERMEQQRKAAREKAGVTLDDCFKIEQECKEKTCKKMSDDNGGILSSSDRLRCKIECGNAQSMCTFGNVREMKISLCKARCQVLSGRQRGFLEGFGSDRGDCNYRCESRY